MSGGGDAASVCAGRRSPVSPGPARPGPAPRPVCLLCAAATSRTGRGRDAPLGTSALPGALGPERPAAAPARSGPARLIRGCRPELEPVARRSWEAQAGRCVFCFGALRGAAGGPVLGVGLETSGNGAVTELTELLSSGGNVTLLLTHIPRRLG